MAAAQPAPQLLRELLATRAPELKAHFVKFNATIKLQLALDEERYQTSYSADRMRSRPFVVSGRIDSSGDVTGNELAARESRFPARQVPSLLRQTPRRRPSSIPSPRRAGTHLMAHAAGPPASSRRPERHGSLCNLSVPTTDLSGSSYSQALLSSFASAGTAGHAQCWQQPLQNVAEKLGRQEFVDFKILVSHEFHYGWHEHLNHSLQEHAEILDRFRDHGVERRLLAARVLLCAIGVPSNTKMREARFARGPTRDAHGRRGQAKSRW